MGGKCREYERVIIHGYTIILKPIKTFTPRNFTQGSLGDKTYSTRILLFIDLVVICVEISTGKVKILLDLGLKKSTRLTIDQLKNQRVIQRKQMYQYRGY